MKKRFFAAAGALFMAAALFGQDTADFTYEAGNGEVTITDYTGSATNVTIPGQINNLPVTAIGDYAFRDNYLTGVTIPDSVTAIGEGAFAINQLTGVIIPGSVIVIEAGTFVGNQLTGVTIPDSVTGIGDYAFAGNQLTGVTIPKSVIDIGDSAFAFNQLTGVTIPNSVTVIGDEAFANNQLTSVTIPDSVTEIGAGAFAYNQLTKVTIPANIDVAGDPLPGNLADVYTSEDRRAGTYRSSDGGETWTRQGAGETLFGQNTDFKYEAGNGEVTITDYTGSATNVTIPERINNLPVTTIGEDAFRENQLTGVTIPDSVTSIGAGAFAENQLTGVTIPNSVTTIGTGAFWGNQLTNITIPANVNVAGDPLPGNLADVYTSGGSRAGTYRSSDGGRTWARQ
jgi:hypothetical protein